VAGIAIANIKGIYKCRKQALSEKEQSQLGVLAVSGVGK
jgi:hypothetical protein